MSNPNKQTVGPTTSAAISSNSQNGSTENDKQVPTEINWQTLYDAIDDLDVKNPDLAVFFELFFSFYGNVVQSVETMSVDFLIYALQRHWKDTTLNWVQFLKLVLIGSSFFGKEHKRLTKLMNPMRFDETVNKEILDTKLETIGITRAYTCFHRSLKPHEEAIRQQDEEQLIASEWGGDSETNPLKEGDVGYIPWCNPANFEIDAKPGLPVSKQPPNCIEECWEIFRPRNDIRTNWEYISQTYLLSKLLIELDATGWDRILGALRKLIAAVRADKKLDIQAKIKELTEEAHKGMNDADKNLIVDSIQDAFLTLSIMMEQMFLSFFKKIPGFVKSIVDRKMKEKDPKLSLDTFIEATQNNLNVFRAFFSVKRFRDLDRNSLPDVLANLSFTEIIEVDLKTLKENAAVLPAATAISAITAAVVPHRDAPVTEFSHRSTIANIGMHQRHSTTTNH